MSTTNNQNPPDVILSAAKDLLFLGSSSAPEPALSEAEGFAKLTWVSSQAEARTQTAVILSNAKDLLFLGCGNEKGVPHPIAPFAIEPALSEAEEVGKARTFPAITAPQQPPTSEPPATSEPPHKASLTSLQPTHPRYAHPAARRRHRS